MSEEKKNNSKNRLDSLKELLKSDTATDFNPKDHYPNNGDFPISNNNKMINYEDEEAKSIVYAENVINDIISNYVKSDDLLKSNKLISIRNQHVTKLAELEDLVRMSKRNLVMIQEAIDSGDLSTEMLRSAKDFMVENRNNIEARSKHIDKCEDYWNNYASMYNLESKEEEIVRNNEKNDDTLKTNHIIMDISKLNDIIDKQVSEIKSRDKEKRKNNKLNKN